MQFPESWLREFCNPPLSTQELADLLTMAGMEVEDLRPVAPPFDRVVVAEVLEVSRHPNADRLNVCQVKVAPDSILNIVCGAPNVRPGIKVPCALVGAQLPPAEEGGKPFEIKLGKLRGVESQGMLCSARELHIAGDEGGLLILSDDALVGNSVRDHLRLDDVLFTLKLTPNLAHGLSVFGIAREVSALTGAPLNQPRFPVVSLRHEDRLPVVIEAPDLCGRFTGRIIRKLDARAKSPEWLVERLARCGQRSVSALVDISNYVMFELGRPSHIFDLDKIHGGLTVRWGRAGEQLKLLNGNTVELDARVGVIADAQAVESLAGIMGGDASAVSDDTSNVYVEAAFWWPESIAGRARRYNFSTDASHRFERGVDHAHAVEHIERITQLVLDICGGEPGPVDDQQVNLPQRAPVALRVARASKVIGMPVSQPQCLEVFQRLGLEVSETPGVLTVTPPSWRFDLQIEEDLIEEVIRVRGFHTLPDTPPLAPVTPRVRPESQRGLNAVRHRVAALDYHETINFSFVEERWERELAGNSDPIRVLNPISAPLSVMRSSLFGSLVSILRFNLARKAPRVRLFEIGRVYKRDPSALATHTTVAGVSQPLRLGGLAYGAADALQWSTKERAVDFFDVKGDIEALLAPQAVSFVPEQDHPALHPGRAARIEFNGEVVGYMGELHPRWRQEYELPSAPVLFELDALAVARREVPMARAIQRQQSVWRDIAVVVNERVTHDALIQTIMAANPTLVRSARLFDIYKPASVPADMVAGERSLAVRLEFLDDVTPLTDERVESVKASVIAALEKELGARLRG